MEKGWVKDVFIVIVNDVIGELEILMGEILEIEKRLRKVVQCGVVKLFNVVRVVQVKVVEVEKDLRKIGVIGMS